MPSQGRSNSGSPRTNPLRASGTRRRRPPKGPFGTSFWVVGSLLAVVLLINAFAGQGEGVLVIAGLVALFTAVYSLVFKRRSWLGLPHQGIATAVLMGGLVCAMLGVVAGVAGVGAGKGPAGGTDARTHGDGHGCAGDQQPAGN